ncbi:UDP-glucose 4-epimerase GalE [Polynucleobacter paneuropaeus]|nr:UDP-glucose 4-epimerase GalE [Polynucleobacter paneuropaeus]
MKSTRILLTGGLGYIGSHTAAFLVEHGYHVVLLDNLCNSKIDVLEKIQLTSGKKIPLYLVDIRDKEQVQKVLFDNQIEAVIHLAGLKSVAESAINPISYYDINVRGSVSLISAMKELKIKKMIYSSSATVYGTPQYLPYDERHPLAPTSVYGKTKLLVEQILQDLVISDSEWSVVSLRYFNPVGAHESGLIGESPNGIPNNLMPYLCQVASGRLPHLNIFGVDYDTKDGTAIRDYIHVMDLAEGHLAAMNFADTQYGFDALNLGTGEPHSVSDLIAAFEKVNRVSIVKKIQARRDGDLPIYYTNIEKAKNSIGWQARYKLEEMCFSAWQFEKRNAIPSSN